MFNGLAGRPRDHFDPDLSRRYPSGAPSLLPGGHPTRLADLGILGASVRLSWPLLSQPCISGGFTDTGVCDRLNLSRLGLGDTLNLTSLQPLGGETLGIDVSVRLNGSCAPELTATFQTRFRGTVNAY